MSNKNGKIIDKGYASQNDAIYTLGTVVNLQNNQRKELSPMLEKCNNVKAEDTKAEMLLRNLVVACNAKGDIQQYVKNLMAYADAARWYLESKDACEFVEETGITCHEAAVRVSYSIPCCEYHAKIRDRCFE